MRQDYDLSLKKLLEHEGGFTNDRRDPGGPTNFGITIFDARRYLNPQLDNAPPWDDESVQYMRDMTVGQAKQIYKPKYWDAQAGDLLLAGVDYFTFDYGVNSGIGRSSRVLQRIVGASPDGHIGPKTLQALAAHDAKSVVRSLHDERLNFLHGLSTWDHFGRGWGRRVEEVTTLSISMAAGNVMAIPHHTFAPAPFRAIDPVRSRRVRAIQSDLAVKGLYRGALDGDDGFQTLLAFQRAESDIKGDVVQRVTIENFDKALAA